MNVPLSCDCVSAPQRGFYNVCVCVCVCVALISQFMGDLMDCLNNFICLFLSFYCFTTCGILCRDPVDDLMEIIWFWLKCGHKGVNQNNVAYTSGISFHMESA